MQSITGNGVEHVVKALLGSGECCSYLDSSKEEDGRELHAESLSGLTAAEFTVHDLQRNLLFFFLFSLECLCICICHVNAFTGAFLLFKMDFYRTGMFRTAGRYSGCLSWSCQHVCCRGTGCGTRIFSLQ